MPKRQTNIVTSKDSIAYGMEIPNGRTQKEMESILSETTWISKLPNDIQEAWWIRISRSIALSLKIGPTKRAPD